MPHLRTDYLLHEQGEQVKLNKQVTKRFSLFVIAILALFAAPVHAQSTDEAHPTAVLAFPVTGTLGAGTYYYSVPATRGRVNMTLEFTPPDGGGSMSVSVSGPSCCTSDAYAGGDAGGPTTTRREAAFAVGTNQTLLITVYIAVAERQSIRYNLSLTGSVGGGGLPTETPRVCTDLAASALMTVTSSGFYNTIRGSIDNRSTTDFRSPADRQWVNLYDTALNPASPILVKRIPFTEVMASRRFQFTAKHNIGKARRIPPRYKIVIVYSPLNSTDDINTNDDCNPANNAAGRLIATEPDF
jgi:hypothetical protein